MGNFNATLLRAGVLALTVATAGTALAEGVDELPEQVRNDLYNPDMLDPMQPVGVSPYRDFKAKRPPPWKIGFASSYAGNTGRADEMK